MRLFKLKKGPYIDLDHILSIGEIHWGNYNYMFGVDFILREKTVFFGWDSIHFDYKTDQSTLPERDRYFLVNLDTSWADAEYVRLVQEWSRSSDGQSIGFLNHRS